MADFGEKQRSRQLSERVSETHEETGTLEHGKVDSGSLDRGSGDHDAATDDDGHTATEVVGDVGDHGQRDNGTNRVHGAETTEGFTTRVAHVVLPGREELHGVQHGAVLYCQCDDLCADRSQCNHLPIVTSGGRSDTQHCSVEVQLPHVR